VLSLTSEADGSLNEVSITSLDSLVTSCKSLCLAPSSVNHQKNCNVYSQALGGCSTLCKECGVNDVSSIKTSVLQSNFSREIGCL